MGKICKYEVRISDNSGIDKRACYPSRRASIKAAGRIVRREVAKSEVVTVSVWSPKGWPIWFSTNRRPTGSRP